MDLVNSRPRPRVSVFDCEGHHWNDSQLFRVDQPASLVKTRANSSTLIGFKLNPIVGHSFAPAPKLTGSD